MYRHAQEEAAAVPPVLVVIIYHDAKSYADTIACLDSLGAMPAPRYDVIVINNGCSELPAESLRLRFPHLQTRDLDENVGFAAANNQGLKHGLARKYPYLLLLNSDTVVEAESVEKLLQAAENDATIGLIGPRTFHHEPSDRIWADGGFIVKWRASIGGRTSRTPEQLGIVQQRYPPNNLGGLSADLQTPLDVDYLPASCILGRSSVIAQTSLLPEEYFFSFEEAELAMQVRALGYRVAVLRDAVIWHKVGLSSSRAAWMVYNLFRSRFLFLRRSYRAPWSWMLMSALVVAALVRGRHKRRLVGRAFIDSLMYRSVRLEHLERVKQLSS